MTELEELKQNEDHLNLLSIFHYVVGGIMFLCSCFPLIYVVLGVAMLVAPESMDGGKNPPPPGIGIFFMALGLVFALPGWALSVCVAISGKFIRQRKRYMFSFAIGAIQCIFMPFGTILGIFTILVLNKGSVKKLYGRPV